MENIHFWNGNKSQARQEHELKLLNAILAVTKKDCGDYRLVADPTDYPSAEDEGNIFSLGADLLVTVAGNRKFAGKAFIPVNTPLANGILGQRILIIRAELQQKLQNIDEDEFKTLRAGIPATWADADLFRHNRYTVIEKGSFGEIFQRLKNNECDYVSLGANEVESIYAQMAAPLNGLIIDTNLVLCYPFPLVFYVHPDKAALAERIKKGLQYMLESGEFDALFDEFYGRCVNSLALLSRREFALENPNLPADFDHTT